MDRRKRVPILYIALYSAIHTSINRAILLVLLCEKFKETALTLLTAPYNIVPFAGKKTIKVTFKWNSGIINKGSGIVIEIMSVTKYKNV